MQRAARGGAASREPVVVEYARSFFPVILIVLLIRSFLFEPFRIPSDSMMPTLLDGDFIFVNKFTYGLRLPVVNTEIVDLGEPQRGDVVVFRLPSDPSTNYIKRLVGLPGDHIVVRDKRVYVNGELQPVELDGVFRADEQHAARADRHSSSSATSQHRVLYIDERPSVDYERRGAGRPLLLHGRQPRQQPRQPLPGSRLRARPERGRQGRAHLAQLESAERADLEPHRRRDSLTHRGVDSMKTASAWHDFPRDRHRSC